MSIYSTVYPKFIEAPFEIQSNWNAYQQPDFDEFKARIIYKAVSDSGDPVDPLMLQMQGMYGFFAPQGYSVTRVHFRDGVAQGAWIQKNPESK